jgi:WD40 repeat protein
MKMTLIDHTDQVLCVAFFKKRIIASGSADKTVRIWKPSPHWQIFRVCEGHTERIRCIVFVNQLIASGSDDTTLKLWDFEGELKHSHKTNGRVGALIPERHFVILTSGKNIQIFDT